MIEVFETKGKYGVTDGARTRDNQNHNLALLPNENKSLPEIFRIFSRFSVSANQGLATTARAIFGNFLRLFRWIYLWHLMLACIGFWSFSTMSTWSRATDTEYNPEGSPIPTAEMVEAIQYALFQITSRLPIEANYTGITGEIEIDEKIVIQWKSFSADDPKDSNVGRAKWHFYTKDHSFARGQVFLNIDTAPKRVDACFRETLVHELAHVLSMRPDHSSRMDDVMYPARGNCRYTLSLSDLAYMQKPVKSCHVELTPDGDLEALDYNGSRVVLERSGASQWTRGDVYKNPLPEACDSVSLQHGDVWLNTKSFNYGPMILRLRPENGVFTSVPL